MRRVEAGHAVDMRNMLRDLLMQEKMAAIMNHIEENGMHAKVKNYDGAYVQIEVTNCNMSFG